jgi:hypothetical protein
VASTINNPYFRCECEGFDDQGTGLCDCGHDAEQHNDGDECLAQEGDKPGDELHEYVRECLAAQKDEESEPDLYRVILTEDGYTTADGPMPKAEAETLYDQFAAGAPLSPNSTLRIVAEAEYQAGRNSTQKPAGACLRREPHECGDDVEYCERCGGYRPDPHRCDSGSNPGGGS